LGSNLSYNILQRKSGLLKEPEADLIETPVPGLE